MRSHANAPLVITCLMLLVLGLISYFVFTYTQVNRAQRFIRICTTAKNREGCYVKLFSDYVTGHSFSSSLNLLHAVQQKDTSLTGCHFIAHVIASEEVKKNPDRWEDIFKQVQVDACTGGYLMGVLEGYYLLKPDELDADRIEEICDSLQNVTTAPSEHTCTHVMGHIILAQAGGNLGLPLKICSNLKLSEQYECYNGVFMENEFQRNILAHTGGAVPVWTSKLIESYEKACLAYIDKPAKSCWREISHMYVSLEKSYPPKVFTLCSKAPNELFQNECYYHAVGIMSVSGKIKSRDYGLLCKPFESHKGQYSRCISIVVNTLSKSSASSRKVLMQFCSDLIEDYKKNCGEYPSADTVVR